MLAGVGANVCAHPASTAANSSQECVDGGVWGGAAAIAMCVSAGSPMFCSVLINSLSKQIAGVGDNREAGSAPASGGVSGWQAGQEEWHRDWKFGQVVFSAGCGSLCQAPDACKHENRSEDTVSGRLCSSWGGRHTLH